MSTLETNAIGKYSGNNVSVDDALNLKSYTTTQRDALTSVAGDMIYNTTLGNPQVYTGSTWNDLKAGIEGFEIQYLVVGGGGGGAYRFDDAAEAGAGGGGGFRNSTTGEETGYPLTVSEQKYIGALSTNYTVTVGAGGSAGTQSASSGNDSQFDYIVGAGGGRGGSHHSGNAGGVGNGDKKQVGCGGGGQVGSYQASAKQIGGTASYGQGGSGSNTGGGGGAGADGSSTSGGAGKSSSITGASVTYSAGADASTNATAAANTGNGGGSSSSNGAPSFSSAGDGKAGGSGIVVLKWLTSDGTITVGAGLTSSSTTSGDYTITTFTAGTDTVSWS